MENHVLIIEDDKDIREGIRILLEGEGFTVTEAENSMEGLQKLSSDISLVILDIMMPGISGLKTCEEIRKTSVVPILFLTAKSRESDKQVLRHSLSTALPLFPMFCSYFTYPHICQFQFLFCSFLIILFTS